MKAEWDDYTTAGEIKTLETDRAIVYLCVNQYGRFTGQSRVEYKQQQDKE